MKDKLITIAIRSYEHAQRLKEKLERSGINAFIFNINKQHSSIAEGFRVRINESDLVKALKVIENPESNRQKSPVEQILIPIDFSDYSLKACEIGFQIAEKFPNVELVLLHAYLIPSTLYSFNRGVAAISDKEAFRHYISRIHADIDNLSNKLQKQIANNQIPNIKFKTEVLEGVPEEVILNYCDEQKPVLVIMGTRGKSQKEEDLIGSVTAEVIEHASVPVLAIPESSESQLIKDINNILFATNFDDRTLLSFKKMMNLLKGFTFNLFLAHFETKHDEWNSIKLAGIKDFFAANYPQVTTNYSVISGDDVLKAFDKFILDNNIHLIVLNTHKRNLFARLFNPSMARKMVFHARIPILVFHT
ncbi:MAG TPA: universal stress protein [Paludibacteraceae bacterium]|nr:universal stress protein [Paludibacteraceae bacterium]